MRWSWQKARPVEPRPMASIRAMELETAKEILAKVFHARPGEVEEMTGWRRAGRRNARKGGGRRRSAWGSSCEEGLSQKVPL